MHDDRELEKSGRNSLVIAAIVLAGLFAITFDLVPDLGPSRYMEYRYEHD